MRDLLPGLASPPERPRVRGRTAPGSAGPQERPPGAGRLPPEASEVLAGVRRAAKKAME